jgi:hypothetical protein
MKIIDSDMKKVNNILKVVFSRIAEVSFTIVLADFDVTIFSGTSPNLQ